MPLRLSSPCCCAATQAGKRAKLVDELHTLTEKLELPVLPLVPTCAPSPEVRRRPSCTVAWSAPRCSSCVAAGGWQQGWGPPAASQGPRQEAPASQVLDATAHLDSLRQQLRTCSACVLGVLYQSSVSGRGDAAPSCHQFHTSMQPGLPRAQQQLLRRARTLLGNISKLDEQQSAVQPGAGACARKPWAPMHCVPRSTTVAHTTEHAASRAAHDAGQRLLSFFHVGGSGGMASGGVPSGGRASGGSSGGRAEAGAASSGGAPADDGDQAEGDQVAAASIAAATPVVLGVLCVPRAASAVQPQPMFVVRLPQPVDASSDAPATCPVLQLVTSLFFHQQPPPPLVMCSNVQALITVLLRAGIRLPPPCGINCVDPTVLAWLAEPHLVRARTCASAPMRVCVCVRVPPGCVRAW